MVQPLTKQALRDQQPGFGSPFLRAQQALTNAAAPPFGLLIA
jgi:hypothetical protein